jgi:hypothetical protein
MLAGAMDYRQLTAPCGLDCFNCAVYLAREDPELRAKVAARLGVPPERAACAGCRAVQGAPAHLGGQPCRVWRCISQKGHTFCHECDEFPCDALHPYADQAAARPHNTKVFNLCLIKRLGVERWGAEKAAQVRATYFGKKFEV